MTRRVLLWMLAASLGPLVTEATAQKADLVREQTALLLERALSRHQQDLIAKSGASERWMDLLVQHHLGLSIDMDEACGLTTEEKALARVDVEQQLTQSLDSVSRISADFDLRQSQLVALRKSIMERPAGEPVGAWGPGIQNLQPPVIDDPHRPLTVPEETEVAVAEEVEAPPPPAPPVLIRGAIDPLHRGVAFFMAGQHDKAVEALQKATAETRPPPIALFYLARAYERLGDVARADGLYLQIEAQAEDGAAGASWTSAARTARQHMNWMRDHGEWRLPPIPKGQPQ